MKSLVTCFGLSIALLSAEIPSANANEDAVISCPDNIAGMPLKEKSGNAVCKYVRGNVDLRLVQLSDEQPSLEEYVETLTAKLKLRAQDNATRLCNEAMAEKKLGARCTVAYDSHVLGLVSEVTHDNQRFQARMTLFERGGVNENHLYWSIITTRALLAEITAE